MGITFVVGDLTEQRVDAIVNAANEALAPGGGVCGAIHRVGGDEIFAEAAALGAARRETRRRQAADGSPHAT
jgi:O-acetyl-ADP-ribose deacetylase (regulator of RNase III)